MYFKENMDDNLNDQSLYKLCSHIDTIKSLKDTFSYILTQELCKFEMCRFQIPVASDEVKK